MGCLFCFCCQHVHVLPFVSLYALHGYLASMRLFIGSGFFSLCTTAVDFAISSLFSLPSSWGSKGLSWDRFLVVLLFGTRTCLQVDMTDSPTACHFSFLQQHLKNPELFKSTVLNSCCLVVFLSIIVVSFCRPWLLSPVSNCHQASSKPFTARISSKISRYMLQSDYLYITCRYTYCDANPAFKTEYSSTGKRKHAEHQQSM